ncbi:uncharacterized protein LOC111638964 [Centruroides sculpturatus]|uniref:uncharacterized protein LOC111638964 n=1 Tax=Centruroides sculpturatus TaxID=218467 RepID=UPI000C6DBB96|nr:uncharacterized protein LOC111638964 [Centruroides sculpturatus]
MFRFILNKTDVLFCRGMALYLLQNKPFQIAVLNHRCYSDDKTSTKKYDERENSILYTITSVFSLSVDSLSFLHQLQNLNMAKIKEWRRKHLRKKEIEDQTFIPERFQILGSDLAAAHFIVHRGGSVRFKDQKNWIRKDKNGNYFLPSKFVSNLYLEEIDASGTGLIYEGFSNLGKPSSLYDESSPDWVPTLYMGYESDHNLTANQERYERARNRKIQRVALEAETPKAAEACTQPPTVKDAEISTTAEMEEAEPLKSNAWVQTTSVVETSLVRLNLKLKIYKACNLSVQT